MAERERVPGLCGDLKEITGERQREFAMGLAYKRKWFEVSEVMRRKRSREKEREAV